MITIYKAANILTMNPTNPTGTHLAVRDGEVLGVGSLDELAGWGEFELDDSFADKVIVPGFVEAHAHVMAGGLMMHPYVGFYDRPLPDGGVARGIRNYDELIAKLRAEDQKLADPEAQLIATGFDPIYFPDQPRLSRHHLDQVSRTRPIYLHHASGHLATANTAMLELNNVTAALKVEGLGRDQQGELDGELREPVAMGLCRTANRVIQRANASEEAMWNMARLARNAGITTCTDLAGVSIMSERVLNSWLKVTSEVEYPLRVAQYNIPAVPGESADFELLAQRFVDLRRRESDKMRFPGVKFILDGSIQGFSAMISSPGYYKGEDHGQLLTVPEQLKDWMMPFHRSGLSIHLHCNGNKTQDLAIEVIEDMLKEIPSFDHRHTITHAQLTTQAQLRKMAKLGICANFFSNHIWYWGDQHYEITVGPERAQGLEPCASAVREGVQFSFHSDAGVTPLGSLHTMWCAVNRMTPKGRVLGASEKITPSQALKAATIDAAYQLHLDHEIGSLEPGKRADFAVLEEDPLQVDPMRIRDIGVWGTVLGGLKFQAEG